EPPVPSPESSVPSRGEGGRETRDPGPETQDCAMRRIAFVFLAATAAADDAPQWGARQSRNMVSGEKNLPESFDLESGRNVRWTARLGAETYCTPIVAGGRVFIGTNNDPPRDPRLPDDRGIFLCLDEQDGHLLWELALTKRGPTNYWDWPRSGHCSPATFEGA